MSFMSYHFILDWSRNKSDESKIKEAQQTSYFYERVKYILNDTFNKFKSLIHQIIGNREQKFQVSIRNLYSR